MITAELRPIATALINTGLFARPPAYSRLEPQSVTGDPTAGVVAAMHDPLWSLLRQWQVGEFAGEDAGTPLAVTIETSSTPITLFAPGTANGGGALAGQPIGSRATLDRLIEAEPPATPGAGSRQRAEASATLIASLAEAGLDVAAVLRELYPFGAGATGDLPRPALAVMLRAAADAELIAADLEAGTPDWLAPGGAAAETAARDWLDWYRGGISPTASGECWDAKRLEYHFSVATDAGRGQKVFTAPMHLGGDVDWHALDLVPGASISAGGDPTFPLTPHDLPPEDATPPTTLAAPLRFAGMAADRFWEFEDGRVNFGSMSVQINDPARLCLIEFATVYGCDWFLAPVEISASAFTTVTSLSVVDSFGVTTTIERAGTGSPGARFRLFEPSIAGTTETARGLLTIGGARGALEGPPRETVLFLRDETANMVWAVETNVEDSSGLVRSRQDERRPIPDCPPADPRAELRYTLETGVPCHWIPMVPVPTAGAANGFVLRKGTMTEADDSRGRILAGKPRDLFDPEVPRGGIRVSRTPTLARDAAGRAIRWTALRSGEGFGELTSGFASDSAEKITAG